MRPTKKHGQISGKFCFKVVQGRTGLQVVDDFLAGVLHEGEEANVSEEGLEDGGSHVGPIRKYEQFVTQSLFLILIKNN